MHGANTEGNRMKHETKLITAGALLGLLMAIAVLLGGCATVKSWCVEALDEWAGYEGGSNVSQVD